MSYPFVVEKFPSEDDPTAKSKLGGSAAVPTETLPERYLIPALPTELPLGSRCKGS